MMKGAAAGELFQTSIITALLEGVYDGECTVEELLHHGDFGLGTFNALDGEMIVLDGMVYKARSDGAVSVIPGDELTPFATVTFFSHSFEKEIDVPLDMDGLERLLERAAGTPNLFYSVRIDGRFAGVKVRSVPRQSRPYPPMTEVAKTQAVFEYRDLDGTLVGFRCPEFFQGVNVAGWHLHFIDTERTRGGHLLGCELSGGTARIGIASGIRMDLQRSDDFMKAKLGKRDTAAAIKAVER